MKRIVLVIGLLMLVAAGGAAAQTRVHVSIGFGVPLPPVVVVERPLFHRAPLVVVVARPYPRPRPLFVERVIIPRHHRYHYRPYYRVHACGYHRCGY